MTLRNVAIAMLLISFTALIVGAPQESPTFYRNVLPILQESCQSCHRPGEVGPMPLMTYDQARPWAKAIRQAVITRKMPPWNAAAPAGRFHNDPSLSQGQIDAIVSWVDSDAPAGNPKDAPPARVFTEGWTMGTPDVVFEARPYNVPPQGTIEYSYLIVPTGFKEDRWVSLAEVRPGDRAVVHHANVHVREPGSAWLREYPAGKWFVPARPAGGSAAVRSAGASLREQVIAGYIPGRPVKRAPDGYGWLIPAGSDLVFQMHYTATGKPASDRSRIGFLFMKAPPTQRMIRIQASNSTFVIPPGADNYPINAVATLAIDAELVDAYPHMHLRGKSMVLTALYPAGQKEEIVNVPNYDFNWQLVYELDTPRKMPRGTVLRADATFDNSPNNRFNPDPKSEVRWGDQTWEEMMVGFFDVAIPPSADPNAVVTR